MGRKSKFQIQQEQAALSAKHYVQYSTLRQYVDISRDVLEELVTLRRIKQYRPTMGTLILYSLEEVQQYISSTCNK